MHTWSRRVESVINWPEAVGALALAFRTGSKRISRQLIVFDDDDRRAQRCRMWSREACGNEPYSDTSYDACIWLHLTSMIWIFPTAVLGLFHFPEAHKKPATFVRDVYKGSNQRLQVESGSVTASYISRALSVPAVSRSPRTQR